MRCGFEQGWVFRRGFEDVELGRVVREVGVGEVDHEVVDGDFP